MKLTVKLACALVLLLVCFIATYVYQRLAQEQALSAETMRLEEHILGRTVLAILNCKKDASGYTALAETLPSVHGATHLEVRWVWLDGGGPELPLAPLAKLNPVLQGDEVTLVEGHGADARHMTYFPVATVPRPAALEVSQPLQPVPNIHAETATRIAPFYGVPLIFLLGLLGLVIYQMVGQPLRLLQAQTVRIGNGDYTPSNYLVGRDDEVGQLARAINHMSAQLELWRANLQRETRARETMQEQLRHTDRLHLVGKMAASITHEFATPLSLIEAKVEGLAAQPNLSPAMLEDLSVVAAQEKRLRNITRQLMTLAHQRTPQKQIVDLPDILQSTVHILAPLARLREVKLECRGRNGGISANVDPALMQQVLINIIMNALQAAPAQSTVQAGVGRRVARDKMQFDEPERDWNLLWVQDEGEGIVQEKKDEIFQAFFTTKKPGSGTGLGLSISYDIVKEHGGWIEVDSTSGTCFNIYLPTEIG